MLIAAEVPKGVEVAVNVTALRSAKGQVMACLTAQPKAFPNCAKDKSARTAVVPARGTVRIVFADVLPGTYAVSLLHDENGNGKPDMAIMIPKEGFGFSRDAKVTFGPPKFGAAAFPVGTAPVEQSVKMKYMF